MEILDLYNAKGERLGKTIERGSKDMSEGEYIKLAVLWIKCKDKYLIQKTSQEKGGEYAVTGGHVPAGIDSLEQAVVEAEEELGLKLYVGDLDFLGNILLKHAMFDVYIYENDKLNEFDFVLQESEVEKVEWLPKDEIENLIDEGLVRKSSVKHYEKFIK